jgi:hypothetical protein
MLITGGKVYKWLDLMKRKTRSNNKNNNKNKTKWGMNIVPLISRAA